MHLEADYLLGRIHSKKKLASEMKEELDETKKGKILLRAIENKKAGRKFKHIKGKEGKQLI